MSSRQRSDSRYSRRSMRRNSSLDRDDRDRHYYDRRRGYSSRRSRRRSSSPVDRHHHGYYPPPPPPQDYYTPTPPLAADFDPYHFRRKYHKDPALTEAERQYGQQYGFPEAAQRGYERQSSHPYHEQQYPPPAQLYGVPPPTPQIRDPYAPPPEQTVLPPLSPMEQKPATPPVTTGPACPFCDESNALFSDKKKLKKHYADFCPCLTRCKWCSRAIEVRKLNEHFLGKCPWLKDTLKSCPKCGQACSAEEMKKHDRGANCQGVKPLDGAAWCTLCDGHVPSDTNDGWRIHLIGPNGCPGNARRTKSGAG